MAPRAETTLPPAASRGGEPREQQQHQQHGHQRGHQHPRGQNKRAQEGPSNQASCFQYQN